MRFNERRVVDQRDTIEVYWSITRIIGRRTQGTLRNVAFIVFCLLFSCYLPSIASDSAPGTFTSLHAYYNTSLDAQVRSRDNGYILAGSYFTPTSPLSPLLIKLDSDGKVVWQVSLRLGGGPYGGVFDGVTELSTGEIVATGYRSRDGSLDQDPIVAKFGSRGDVKWKKVLPSIRTDSISAILERSTGGILIGGTTDTYASTTGGDAWLVALDSRGAVEWSRIYGGDYFDYIVGIHELRPESILFPALRMPKGRSLQEVFLRN